VAVVRTPQPMIRRRAKPVRAVADLQSAPRPERSASFAPNPVVTPDVYGNNPTLGTFKQMLELAPHPVGKTADLPEFLEPPAHDERLVVSLQEAVDHRIVEGLSLSALRKASQRAGFPPMVSRERRGNVGAPERLYRAAELAAWSCARMQHHAALR
jgi:hypothetical protein